MIRTRARIALKLLWAVALIALLIIMSAAREDFVYRVF